MCAEDFCSARGSLSPTAQTGSKRTQPTAAAPARTSQEYVEKKKVSQKKKKAQANRQEDKALGWGGWDDKVDPKKCTVIMKHLFEPDELLAEAKAVTELEEDITTARSVRPLHTSPSVVRRKASRSVLFLVA